MFLTRTVIHGGLEAIYDHCVLATGPVGCMATFGEGFEDGFIRLNLFICLSVLGLILLQLMDEDLFRLLVKCRKRQVVEKVRANEMAFDIVASIKVILDQYQHRFLVGTENADDKITQIFYPCNSLEVKLDGFSKSRQRLSIIGWTTDLDNAQFGEGFPLKATLLDLKLGGSKCLVVLIRKTAAKFVLKIGHNVDKSVLRYQHSLVRYDILTTFFSSRTTSIAWYFLANLDGIRLIER